MLMKIACVLWACFFGLVSVSFITETSFTVAGCIGALLVLLIAFGAGDGTLYLLKVPLRSVTTTLLKKPHWLGALLIVLVMVTIGLPTSAVIWLWASLFPDAFNADQALPAAIGRGFAVALWWGVLAYLDFPIRLGRFRSFLCGKENNVVHRSQKDKPT